MWHFQFVLVTLPLHLGVHDKSQRQRSRSETRFIRISISGVMRVNWCSCLDDHCEGRKKSSASNWARHKLETRTESSTGNRFSLGIGRSTAKSDETRIKLNRVTCRSFDVGFLERQTWIGTIGIKFNCVLPKLFSVTQLHGQVTKEMECVLRRQSNLKIWCSNPSLTSATGNWLRTKKSLWFLSASILTENRFARPVNTRSRLDTVQFVRQMCCCTLSTFGIEREHLMTGSRCRMSCKWMQSLSFVSWMFEDRSWFICCMLLWLISIELRIQTLLNWRIDSIAVPSLHPLLKWRTHVRH